MRLCLHKETSCRVPQKKLRLLFDLVIEEEAEPDSQSCVNIVFTTDSSMKKLNRKFRNTDRSTDVLSFNIDTNGEPDSVFGEIYISAATARRQARSYKGTFSEEIIRLACHGLLHLFGYDHQTRFEEAIMKELEERFLNGIEGK